MVCWRPLLDELLLGAFLVSVERLRSIVCLLGTSGHHKEEKQAGRLRINSMHLHSSVGRPVKSFSMSVDPCEFTFLKQPAVEVKAELHAQCGRGTLAVQACPNGKKAAAARRKFLQATFGAVTVPDMSVSCTGPEFCCSWLNDAQCK